MQSRQTEATGRSDLTACAGLATGTVPQLRASGWFGFHGKTEPGRREEVSPTDQFATTGPCVPSRLRVYSLPLFSLNVALPSVAFLHGFKMSFRGRVYYTVSRRSRLRQRSVLLELRRAEPAPWQACRETPCLCRRRMCALSRTPAPRKARRRSLGAAGTHRSPGPSAAEAPREEPGRPPFPPGGTPAEDGWS